MSMYEVLMVRLRCFRLDSWRNLSSTVFCWHRQFFIQVKSLSSFLMKKISIFMSPESLLAYHYTARFILHSVDCHFSVKNWTQNGPLVVTSLHSQIINHYYVNLFFWLFKLEECGIIISEETQAFEKAIRFSRRLKIADLLKFSFIALI